MEHFIVSARKYRPQTFASVVGQSHITTTLKNAIKSGQLAHAFLFCGPRGVGKTTCARILAKTINCENLGPDGEACDTCSSCKTFNEGQSFNIHELDAASNNSVDDIRTLTEQVRFAPQAGKYKIYIIDEVHMLSAAAFNAFLKTLEEPPPYAIFILATTEKHKILPTILSRCQIFDFRRITLQDTVDHLMDICRKEHIQAESDALHLIAQKSEGCMRDALSILDKIVSFSNGKLSYANTLEHLNILDYDYYFRVMEALLEQDGGEALNLLDEILQKGFEADQFLEGMSQFLRDLLVCKDERVLRLLDMSENLKSRYMDLSRRLETAWLLSALQILQAADTQYRLARNKRLHVELALIRLAYLEQAISLIAEEPGGDVAKKKLNDPLARPQTLRQSGRSAVSQRNPEPSAVRKEPQAARLSIEATRVPSQSQAPSTEDQKRLSPHPKGPVNPEPEPSLAQAPASEPIPEPVQTAPAAPPSTEYQPSRSTNPAPAGTSKRTKQVFNLEHIRREVASQNRETDPVAARDLILEECLELWQQRIERRRSEQMLQAAEYLSMVDLQVLGSLELGIRCRNDFLKHYVEEEKLDFAESLKERFHQNQISITIEVDETLETDTGPEILSQRQQLDRMMEIYPMVRKLKETLNLDLD